MTANEVIKKASNLKTFWEKRNTKFKEWYETIQLVDKLSQDNMESFVSSDPRAAYNLLLHMLETDIPHKFEPSEIGQELLAPAAVVRELFSRMWKHVFRNYRKTGRTGFMRDYIGFLLATGWGSIFAVIDDNMPYAEVWNPATVFPSWEDELVECSHIFEVTAQQAKRMADKNEWKVDIQNKKMPVYDYWWVGDKREVHNAVVLGDKLAKADTVEQLSRIPIFVMPTGGLPDMGQIVQSDDWRAEVGQSFIAASEPVLKAFNKWWTFGMQILRDVAQPRWYEKTSGGTRILKQEDIFKRGAIFRMGLQDEIGVVQMPVFPMEIRPMQLDMEAMLQRSGPSYAMYGAIQQPLTTYVMSQIASSAHQMVKPFHDTIIQTFTDIDNFWLEDMRKKGYKIFDVEVPKEIPDNMELSADYDIEIPGDLTRRATEARMLNPIFQLSLDQVYSKVFPNIKNPIEDQAKAMRDKALQHPVFAQLALADALEEHARLMHKAGRRESARRALAAVEAIERTLAPEPGGVQPTLPPNVPTAEGEQPENTEPPYMGMPQP